MAPTVSNPFVIPLDAGLIAGSFQVRHTALRAPFKDACQQGSTAMVVIISAKNTAGFRDFAPSCRLVVSVHRKSSASHVQADPDVESPRIFDNET